MTVHCTTGECHSRDIRLLTRKVRSPHSLPLAANGCAQGNGRISHEVKHLTYQLWIELRERICSHPRSRHPFETINGHRLLNGQHINKGPLLIKCWHLLLKAVVEAPTVCGNIARELYAGFVTTFESDHLAGKDLAYRRRHSKCDQQPHHTQCSRRQG